jgi:hypothetical protein
MIHSVTTKEEHEAYPSIPAFDEWVEGAPDRNGLDVTQPKDIDRLLLSCKPAYRAMRYMKMKAFGNHFRVEDATSPALQTYDSGIASVFEVPTINGTEVSANYVGVVKDIFKLDYGPLHTPVIILRCEWMKRQDNRGNSTYSKDEAGFLTINFRHKLPRIEEPFIFASQATQVFFSDVNGRPGWKVVLQKEVRSRREVMDTSEVFITTTTEANGLIAPEEVTNLLQTTYLDGAIELSTQEHLLAVVKF